MKRLMVPLSAMFLFITLAQAGALPRGLQEMGIPVPVTLSMQWADLKGHQR